MGNFIYVTCNVIFPQMLRGLGYTIKRFAVRCVSEDEARKARSDLNSYDGVTYVRVNRCGRISDSVKVLLFDESGCYDLS